MMGEQIGSKKLSEKRWNTSFQQYSNAQLMRLAYITQKQEFVQVELVLWHPVKSVQVAPVSPSQYSVQQFAIADVALF